MRYNTLLIVAAVVALLIATTIAPVLANTVMSESFTTDPFADRWSKDLIPGEEETVGEIIYAAQNGVFHNNPDPDGHVYSRTVNTTIPGQQMTWLGSFTTDGFQTARLSFYLKNDQAGGIVRAEVKDGDGNWQEAWNGDLSATWTTWTEFQVDLPYTVTGVRFYMLAPRTRLDEISITGLDPVPEPSSLLALASGFVGLTGFAIRRRR